MKTWARTLAINVVILGFLVAAVNFLAVTVNVVETAWGAKEDARGRLPNYADDPWAPTHFREFAALDTEYRSYYGWRRLPFAGETITIDGNGIRRTVQGAKTDPARSIAFFGGSTMWGSGVNDENTIPSLFAARNADYLAYNFGESAHTAHQNLNVLIEQLAAGFLPEVVVFYNGVNEVGQCRRELRPFAHVREQQIKSMLDTGGPNVHDSGSYLSLFLPAQELAKRLSASISYRLGTRPPPFDCDRNPAKAEAIARLLLWDWTMARQAVESYGGRFLAVLQPVVYFSRTRTDHIEIEADRAAQYEAVYPIILELLQTEFADLRDSVLDLRAVLDRDDYIYIDFCHVSSRGNDLIAAAIGRRLGG